MGIGRTVGHGTLLALLLVSASLPSLNTAAGWDATSYAGWPGVGLSVALFLAVGQSGRRAAFVIQSIGLGIVLAFSYDVVWWQGVLASLAVTGPALLAAHWLLPGSAGHRRFNEGEVDVFHGVTAAAGLVCGLLSTAAAAAADRGNLVEVLLTGFIAFFAATTAQLLILPFWLRTAGGWMDMGHSLELWTQRTMIALFTAGIFFSSATLPVAFLIFPVLGWAAIRATAPETHVQVLLVSLAAFTATLAGRGPLALGSIQDPSPFAPLLVYMFVASLCYLIVPLGLTVARLTTVTMQATGAATTVRRMLDSATGTVFIATDPAGRITHWNSGAKEALGYDADEVLGHQSDLLHTDAEIERQAQNLGVPLSQHPMLYPSVVATQSALGLRLDWQFQRKDGEKRMISLSVSPLIEPRGNVVGFIASGEDITERVRAQRALEQAFQHEHDTSEALRAANDVKQELVSTVSHELRTPITNITGFTELLIDGDLGELTDAQLEAIGRIESNSARLRHLVGDLLTLSRVESGAFQLTTQAVDLNEVALRSHEMLAPLLATRSLAVRLCLGPDPVVVPGDPDLLERAMTNLWSDAVKFTPDGGTIELTVEGPAQRSGSRQALVTVRDTGMGIPAEEQRDVFTRFYRAASAGALAIQGSGLGLSIVRAIVDQHDGEIALDSAPGTGTTVRIALPTAIAASIRCAAEPVADETMVRAGGSFAPPSA